MIKLPVAVVFYFLYWFICFLSMETDKKNLAGLRSYLDAVQQTVRNHPTLGKTAPRERSVAYILLANIMLFTVVFSLLGIVLKSALGLDSHWAAFLYFLILGEGLGVFDLVIIDLLWWRNTARIRFSFLPEKEVYQASDKHIGSFLRGIPMFALVAALSPRIVTVL